MEKSKTETKRISIKKVKVNIRPRLMTPSMKKEREGRPGVEILNPVHCVKIYF